MLGDFQELAREHTIEALDVLVQIMLNEKAPPNARVAAASTLLDRAYGKAPTFLLDPHGLRVLEPRHHGWD